MRRSRLVSWSFVAEYPRVGVPSTGACVADIDPRFRLAVDMVAIRAGGMLESHPPYPSPVSKDPHVTSSTNEKGAAHEYVVQGMTCSHCVASVREDVAEVAGVENVDLDLASGRWSSTMMAS